MNLLFSAFLISCLSMGTPTVSPQSLQQDPAAWKTYVGDSFSIQYPPNWDFDASGQYGAPLFLFSPMESPTDTFRENVNLYIDDLAPRNINIQQYLDLTLDQVKTSLAKGKLIENTYVEKPGLAYYKLIYSGVQSGYELTFEQFLFVRGTKVYILNLTSQPHAFPKLQPLGERIMESFRWK